MGSQRNLKYTCHKENFCTSALTDHASLSKVPTSTNSKSLVFLGVGGTRCNYGISAGFPEYMLWYWIALVLLELSCPFTKATNVDNSSYLILSIVDILYSCKYYVEESTLFKRKTWEMHTSYAEIFFLLLGMRE